MEPLESLLPNQQSSVDKNSAFLRSKIRLSVPIRNQVEVQINALDDLLPDEHKARFIWEYVNKMDLSHLMLKVKSTESNAGRPAIDPRLLLSIWLLAIVEGIGSARMIERYCSEHIAFKWMCGGVKVNYHTISDFRINHENELDKLFTESIAILMHSGLVTLNRISQDGMKVKANAGKGSFKTKQSLNESLKEAQEQVDALKAELETNPAECSNRVKAAKKKAAEERYKKIQDSLEELDKYTKQKADTSKKQRKKLKETEKEKTKVSTTDSQARKMQMNNQGYSPAYNVQLATDHCKRAIVGVKVINNSADYGQLNPMLNQIRERLGFVPKEMLADAGYFSHTDIEAVSKANQECSFYIRPKNKYSYKQTAKKSEIIQELEERMASDKSKRIMKERASTAEFVNAVNRNRGLSQFQVRGLDKVNCVMLMFAIAHNMMIAYFN